MLFAGRNHLFCIKTSFLIFFCHKWKKRKKKGKRKKITRKTYILVLKKMISTSEQCAEHPLASQNTQQQQTQCGYSSLLDEIVLCILFCWEWFDFEVKQKRTTYGLFLFQLERVFLFLTVPSISIS